MRLYFPLVVAVFACIGGGAQAMPVPDQSVPIPVDRLVENVSKYIGRHPNDIEGYYTLARVHSIAYARSFLSVPFDTSRGWDSQGRPALNITVVRGTGSVEQQKVPLPEGSVPTSSPVVTPDWPLTPTSEPSQRCIKAKHIGEGGEKPETTLPNVNGGELESREDAKRPPTSGELHNLNESVRNYAKVTSLDPAKGYYWLGYAWMLEQGIPFSSNLGQPWVDTTANPQPGNSAVWSAKALETYRRAYKTLLRKYDFKYYDGAIIESGEGIQRLLAAKGHRPTKPERTEITRIRATLSRVKKGTMIVSPIILPLTEAKPLHDLLAPATRTKFDLAGDGLGRHWPWVKPETGILVWDPDHRGQITSGRQLFGNVTWWVFWRNGYEALAALDDNGDGELSGAELNGIGIWRDSNGNGVSEAGEVRPVTDWGIVSLSTQNTGLRDGVPSNLAGATTASGVVLPTYDWTPASFD